MPAVLAELAKLPPVDLTKLPPPEGRKAFDAVARIWNRTLPPLAFDQPGMIATPGGDRPTRRMRPPGTCGPGRILFLHGGGWTFGNLDSHARTMAILARASRTELLAIDYRLAPEHPHPAAVDDAEAAFSALAAEGPVVLAGDSAGANIALGLAVRLREKGGPMPAGLCLFYGCFAPIFDTASHRAFGTGLILTTERMQWYWNNWLGDRAASPESAPLTASMTGMPPTYLAAAGLDPLLDDSNLMAASLSRAGVRTTYDVFPGVPHGFLQFTRLLPAARTALATAGRAARGMLTGVLSAP
jgi:acetyl esterase